jgi:hypothetical protein
MAPRLLQVALQPAARLFAKGHQALLAALAHHAQHAFVQAHLKGLERDQLRHAQAAGIHQLQHGAVAQAQRVAQVGALSRRLHLGLRQGLGHAQGWRAACRRSVGSGDAALAQSPVKVARSTVRRRLAEVARVCAWRAAK